MADSALGRRFWTLWAATATSNLGDGITLTTFPLLAVTLTDDAVLIALVAVGRSLPFVMLGLPLGLIVDRFDRRTVTLVSQGLRGGVITAVAFIVAADQASIPILVAAAFVVGLGEVLTDGATPALVRSVVRQDQLEVANSRLAAAMTVTNAFVGPPLGALLFVIAGWLPFAAVVATFVLAGLFMVALPGSYRAEVDELERQTSVFHQVTLGLRYVWGHDVLRPLALTVAAFAFLNEANEAIFVLLVTDHIGLGEIGFGLLISADAIVAVITSFFVAVTVLRIGHSGSMKASVVLYGGAMLVFGFGTSAGTADVAAVLRGISNPLWNVVSATIRQRLVPDQIFGRMMTAYLFIAWGVQPLGAIAGGLVAWAWGPEWVYLISAPAMVVLYVGARPMFAAVDRAMGTGS